MNAKSPYERYEESKRLLLRMEEWNLAIQQGLAQSQAHLAAIRELLGPWQEAPRASRKPLVDPLILDIFFETEFMARN